MTAIALNVNQITQLFHAHHAAIVAFLAKRGCCPETAQDLGQETYLRLLSKAEISHDDNLKAYLFRIAERLAVDYLRKSRQVKNNSVALNDELPCPKLLPDELAEIRQQCEQLIYAIELLPEKIRRVFLLRKIDELSYAEIALRLGISEKTVQRHLVNGMLHCHQFMQHE
ncbi:MAG: RNA polymerase sigma factor [Methylococcales bacterium]